MADTRSVDDEFLRILPETIPWDKVGSGETQCLGPVGLPSWYCYHENDIKRAAALCGPKEDRSGNERLDWLLLWVNYPFNFTVLGIPGFQVPPCITLAESLYYRETFNLLALTSRTVSPDGVRLLQEVLDRAKASEAGSGLPGADSEDLVKVSGQKWVRNGVQKAQKEAQGTESQEFASSELSVSRRVTRPPPPVRSSPEQPKEMSGVEELVKLRNKITELESKLALHEAQHTQCVHDPHDDLKLAVQKMIDYWDNPPGPNIDLESLEIPSYPDPGPAIVQEENPKSDVLLIEFNRLINRRKVLKEHAKKIDGLLQKIGTPDAHSVILDQGIRDEMGRVLERTNREADLYQELQNQKEQLAQELVTLKESIEGMKEQRKKNKDMKAERVRILKEEMERKIREEMEGEEEEQKEWEWGLQNEREGSDEEQDAL